MPENDEQDSDRSESFATTSDYGRKTILAALGIMGLAVTGYFIGLGAPMPDSQEVHNSEGAMAPSESTNAESTAVIPATACIHTAPATICARL